MIFSWPWLLFLLPLALLPLKQHPKAPITLSSLHGWEDLTIPGRVRALSALRGLCSLAIALIVIGLAGPHRERHLHQEQHQGVAIELLVDISSSMDQSINPSKRGPNLTRMDAAKEVVAAFIENRPDDLIGLITFARYADTLSPLTFGHRALLQLVEELTIQDRPNEDGTAYGDALALASAHLAQIQPAESAADEAISRLAAIQSKVVILLTDGENNCGRHLPQEAAALAREWGIRLYTISLGERTDQETVLTDADSLLEKISQGTGGAFWKIADQSELSGTYAEIDALEKSDIQINTRVHTEMAAAFHWFILPALGLLLMERILRATLLRITEETAP